MPKIDLTSVLYSINTTIASFSNKEKLIISGVAIVGLVFGVGINLYSKGDFKTVKEPVVQTGSTVSGEVVKQSTLKKDTNGNVNILFSGMGTGPNNKNNILLLLSINIEKKKFITNVFYTDLEMNSNIIKRIEGDSLRNTISKELGVQIPYYANLTSDAVENLLGAFGGKITLGGAELDSVEDVLNFVISQDGEYTENMMSNQFAFIINPFLSNSNQGIQSLLSRTNMIEDSKKELSSIHYVDGDSKYDISTRNFFTKQEGSDSYVIESSMKGEIVNFGEPLKEIVKNSLKN